MKIRRYNKNKKRNLGHENILNNVSRALRTDDDVGMSIKESKSPSKFHSLKAVRFLSLRLQYFVLEAH